MIGVFTAHWTEFWFTPAPASCLRFVRRGLCVVAAIYFASALGDVDTWFQRGAPASSSNLATFFRTAELTSDARWMISPLFIWDSIFAQTSLGESAFVYRCYLLVGIALALLAGVADQLGRFTLPRFASVIVQGCWPTLLLWVWFVGWANRIVLLAGIVEPLLSVSLAALAIAPIGQQDHVTSWRTTFAQRLIALQTTLIAILTTATLLASPTWWNGTGAYALVAPAQDRLFVATDTFFEITLVYELTTALIVCVLPIGIFLAWKPAFRKIGIGLVVAWCVVVGFLSANVLYAATLGIIVTTIGGCKDVHTPTGANGANSLNGGSVESQG